MLAAGVRVEAHGLKGSPELNGQQGVVLSFDKIKARFAVKFDEGSALNVKPSNLRVVVVKQPIEDSEKDEEDGVDFGDDDDEDPEVAAERFLKMYMQR